MPVSRDWEQPIRRMERLLRLKTFPIAFKLLENKADLAGVPFLRRLGHRSTLCQLLNIVRSFDWTVGADESDLMAPMCTSIIGLTDIPELMRDGTFRSVVWSKTKKDGEKYENSIPRIPTGRYEAVVMAPLAYNPFDPDIVLIYANPAQMIVLINALQFENYEVMQFYCVGESSCSDAIARCYLTRKPSLTIPCYGERRYGHTQDDELVMAIPAEMVDKAVEGLEVLYKRGIRYPISYAGTESDISRTFPGAYLNSPTLTAAAPENKKHLLLGVTGGIATGKTAVSRMLEELGAPIIDFDILARTVVEPGKPAYEDIVAFFGRQVLGEDGALNRKRLGEIVFSDLEKRKKLEGFTHPRIGEEFIRLIGEHTKDKPDVIIQVAVPLLIEQNMNHLFDKLVLVYTPEEIQMQRLMERESISEEAARAMVASQLSIEDKKGYVDFIIDNTGPLNETRRQVLDLWETLLKLQMEKTGKKGGTDGK